jgi:hypothetical protein
MARRRAAGFFTCREGGRRAVLNRLFLLPPKSVVFSENFLNSSKG